MRMKTALQALAATAVAAAALLGVLLPRAEAAEHNGTAAGSTEATLTEAFEAFRLRFGRAYAPTSDEYARRRDCFRVNLAAAARMNATAQSAKEGHTARYGVTKFSDLCPGEYATETSREAWVAHAQGRT